MPVFSKRLKQARCEAGLSQERLGVLAGIDEMSASARMNQYEKGKHEPDFSMVERIARALDIPVPYFYAEDDDEALLLRWFRKLSAKERAKLIQKAKGENA
jgi:transcriptional regulator with XRE-family HTH domain